MDTHFSPTDHVIQPSEPAWVERLPDGGYAIHWQGAAERVAVSILDAPDPDAEPLARYEFDVAPADRSVVIRPPSDTDYRPYFLLDLDNRRHLIAERTLPLPSGVNFRDIGGYQIAGGYRTADGRAVRWGQVFRSGSLAELSDEDLAYLGQLGLRLSCDLRSPEEVAARPDRLPAGAAVRPMPVAAQTSRLRRVFTLFRLRHRVQELLLNVYTVMLDQNGPLFAELIRLAADPANRPLVIHCTAGKDRTGLAVALLLLTLGVPEETVIADYTLSNHAYEVLAERMGPEMERLYAFGFEQSQLRPFLLAESRTLTSALAHLRRRYGSVESYLSRAGLDEATIEQARQTLLTP